MELYTVKCRTVVSSRENHSFVPLGEKVQSRASMFQTPLLRFLPIVGDRRMDLTIVQLHVAFETAPGGVYPGCQKKHAYIVRNIEEMDVMDDEISSAL